MFTAIDHSVQYVALAKMLEKGAATGRSDGSTATWSSVKFSIFGPLKGGQCFSSGQKSEQQELQPFEKEIEAVTGCCEHGVNGIVSTMRQIIAVRAVFGLEMTDHGFDSGAPSELAFDLGVSRRSWPDV